MGAPLWFFPFAGSGILASVREEFRQGVGFRPIVLTDTTECVVPLRQRRVDIIQNDPPCTLLPTVSSMSADSDAGGSSSPQGINYYPQRTPRFWHGMRFFAAIRLLARNHFRVHPFRWGMVFTVLLCGIINSILSLLQACLHGRKIAAVSLEGPPVFIVGHWRSGTTYLHELMVRDKRFAYASTYDCFAPHHFVITSWTRC